MKNHVWVILHNCLFVGVCPKFRVLHCFQTMIAYHLHGVFPTIMVSENNRVIAVRFSRECVLLFSALYLCDHVFPYQEIPQQAPLLPKLAKKTKNATDLARVLVFSR